MRQWRLIYDPPTCGALNMARDEAILSAVERGDSPPTLRLYGWSPACLSLGYGQHAREADLDRLAQYGWDIVRRPTGGKAILHTDELTYSLALPLDDPLAENGVVESYRRLSTAITAALEHLGAQVQADRQDSGEISSAVCFDAPSDYEITTGGRKLVGSAQLRRKNALLQHGSIPLEGDIGRICDVLFYESPTARTAARTHVYHRAVVLSDVLDASVTWQDAAYALANGFASTFDVDWLNTGLTDSEQVEASALSTEKYAQESWTLRR